MNAVLYVDEDAPTPRRIVRGSNSAITRPASKITDAEAASWTGEITGNVEIESITLPRPSRPSIAHADTVRAVVRPTSVLVIDAAVPVFAGGPETTHTNALAYDRMLTLDRLMVELSESESPRVAVTRLPRVEVRTVPPRPPTLGKAMLARHGGALHATFAVLFALGFVAALGYFLAVV